MSDPKAHKLLLAELETHDAYPEGLDAGPFNEAHGGSPSDIERALKLQLGSLRERLGLPALSPEQFAIQRFKRAQDRAAELDGYDWSAAVDEIMSDLDRGHTAPTEEMLFGV